MSSALRESVQLQMRLRGLAPSTHEAYLHALEELARFHCSPDATNLIREAMRQFGDRMNIGAGTVLDIRQLYLALDAGAGFIVTPTVMPKIIKACVADGVPVFPGALTPTEIQRAWRAGASTVKLFPANTFGPAYLKAVLAPLDHVSLLPVGGVDLASFKGWMQAGASGVGVGSPLFDSKRIAAHDWAWLEAETKQWHNAWQAMQPDLPNPA